MTHPAPKRLNVFERYLSIWVALCMAAGIALGKVLPGLTGAVQVSLNDLIMLVLFAPIVGFLVTGASNLTVPFGVLVASVVVFIVIPLTFGTLVPHPGRRGRRKGLSRVNRAGCAESKHETGGPHHQAVGPTGVNVHAMLLLRKVAPAPRRPASTLRSGAATPRSLNPFPGNWLPPYGRSTVSHRPQQRLRSSGTAILASFALLTLLGASMAPAEEPVRITLAEALALAEQQNPDLAAAHAQARAAQEEAEAVRRGTLPHLDLSAGWSVTDIPSAVFAHKLDSGDFAAEDFAISRLNDPSALWHLGTAVQVEAPIDAFGKIRTAAESASAHARSAEAQVSEGRLDLRLQVVLAYRRAALARRAVEVTEQALEGARAREADAEARVRGGAALQSDLLRARARRREREADLAERRGEVRAAAAGLARALGAPAGLVYEAHEDAEAPQPLDGDLAAWTARALSARPVLAAAEAAAEAARQGAQGEERSKLPDLALWGQVQDNRIDLGDGKVTGAAGVSLRWRAFDPSRDRKRAAAEATLAAAEAQARAAADQVRFEVETAWHRAQAARERSAAAAGGAEEGREALRVVRERRLAGMATLTDELETETASLAAELQELRAATDAALADAALDRATGDRP